MSGHEINYKKRDAGEFIAMLRRPRQYKAEMVRLAIKRTWLNFAARNAL